MADPRTLLRHLETPFAEFSGSEASPRDVMLAGLAWPTENWVALAISWLEQGAPLDEDLTTALEKVSSRPLSQSVRQRARAQVRRWRRATSSATS